MPYDHAGGPSLVTEMLLGTAGERNFLKNLTGSCRVDDVEAAFGFTANVDAACHREKSLPP